MNAIDHREPLGPSATVVDPNKAREDSVRETDALPELYFATVKAIGTDIDPALHILEACLGNAGYLTMEIHLSKLFHHVPVVGMYLVQDGSRSEYDVRNGFMDAGDALRTIFDSAAMAKLGIYEICRRRDEAYEAARREGRRGVAFIIRSLMHESEVSFLRAVLGTKFFVISMFSHEDHRRNALLLDLGSRPGPDEVSQEELEGWADDLMRRDQGRSFLYPHALAKNYAEIERLSIEKTFHEADCFVDLDRSELATRQIKRFVELIFGYPYSTTTEDETALAHAFVALRQSASVARQVGAAIVVDGVVVVTGRNDVPRAGGGQLLLPATGEPSEVMSAEPEASNQERADVFSDVLRRLLTSEDWAELMSRNGVTGLDGLNATVIEAIVKHSVELDAALDSRVFDLIEFNPTVHAEMSAITTAARRGFPLLGGTLYTTTFPCHECTRHIISTGISRVVYLEPYPKSRAEALFPGQVRMGEKEDVDEADERVLYEPFMGIAPRRQQDLFSWVPRENTAEIIKGWTLNRTRELRTTIDPVVPAELGTKRNKWRHEEQGLAVEEFWERVQAGEDGQSPEGESTS